MKRNFTLACVLSLVAAAAFAQGAGKELTVPLNAQNASGESGTVTLVPEGDKTRVTIKLDGAPAGVAQPAHVHQGSCDKIDPKPLHPLADVKGGASSSTVPAKVEAIADGKHSVNVHMSGTDLKTYVACATLKR